MATNASCESGGGAEESGGGTTNIVVTKISIPNR